MPHGLVATVFDASRTDKASTSPDERLHYTTVIYAESTLHYTILTTSQPTHLGAEGVGGDKLPHGVPVVVEPAHEALVHHVRYPQRLQPLPHNSEMLPAARCSWRTGEAGRFQNLWRKNGLMGLHAQWWDVAHKGRKGRGKHIPQVGIKPAKVKRGREAPHTSCLSRSPATRAHRPRRACRRPP